MNNPFEKVVDKIVMQRVAGHVVFVIRRRTQQGKFLDGSSPNAEQYSTKPFAMPAYALGKMLGKKIEAGGSYKGRTQGASEFSLFRNEKWQNSLWVISHLGYKRIRQIAGKPVDVVSMIWSGAYLRDFGILLVEENKSQLGWKSAENQQLALYHEELGAGKSRRKHKILGLTNEEINSDLLPYAQTEIIKKLNSIGMNVRV